LTTVKYLEHTISSDGVRPGKDKRQAVKDITELKTMKQFKSFIGLANYFQSYVNGFQHAKRTKKNHKKAILHTIGYYVKVANREGRPSVDLVGSPNMEP
jgi:uncharacterized protein YbgA (DUF1722 family)